MKLFIVGFLIITVMFHVALPLAEAQTTIVIKNPLCPPSNPNCSRGSVMGLLDSILTWLIYISLPIATAMIIIAAFKMMTAGSADEFNKAKWTVLYILIGFAIILVSKGITLILVDLLSNP